MIDFLLKGILIGFVFAAPLGPIGILCIRITLQYGKASGFCAGCGAAVARGLYSCIAAFGITLLSDFLTDNTTWIRAIGGLFMLYLAWRTYFSDPEKQPERPYYQLSKWQNLGLWKDFIEMFFLTLTNPSTVVAYLAIFAGFANTGHHYLSASALVVGVVVGSALGGLALSEGVALLRKRVERNLMLWINRVSGILIALFGLWALSGVFY